MPRSVLRSLFAAPPPERAPGVEAADEAAARIEDRLERIAVHTWEAKESQRLEIEEAILARRAALYGPRDICRHLAQVYSQSYEDAIIAEILSRIGEGGRRFLEIGVEDGSECNTRLLLEAGWTGIWIEADPGHAARIRESRAEEIASGALALVEAFVTRESVADLIAGAGGGPFDVASVDVDYNTSHIWEAIPDAARLWCIEYNASYPPTRPFAVPYDPGGVWDGSNHFGASLKTMEEIGRAKGAALVGCDVQGANAFFVEEGALGDRFAAPFTAEHHHQPARYPLLKVRGHPRRPAG